MSAREASGVVVDVCRDGCGGVWFDQRELEKVDESFEPAPDDLLDVPHEPAPLMDAAARRSCPRCPSLVLMRHHVSVRREIEIDECPGCAGVFLDHGELAAIRNQFESQEERREAARRHYAEVFDGALDEVADTGRARAERARRFARLLRFVLPSHWLPGKQPWGAF